MTVPNEEAWTGFSSFPHLCQQGTREFLHWGIEAFNLANSGCFNPDSELSSGEPSWHAYGKAADFGCWWWDPTDHGDGDRLWNWCLEHKEEIGLQQMIWGNRIVDVRDGHRVRYYSGSDHYNHIHVAMSFRASQDWRPPGLPYTPEEDMTPEEHNRQLGMAWIQLKHDDILNWLAGIEFPQGFENRGKSGNTPRTQSILKGVEIIGNTVIRIEKALGGVKTSVDAVSTVANVVKTTTQRVDASVKKLLPK